MSDNPLALGYRFKVQIGGPNAAEADMKFQKVNGLTATMATESLAEGGILAWQHELPTGTTYGQLELIRGLLVNSELEQWIRDCIYNYDIVPKNILISLLDDQQKSLYKWEVTHAFPTEWSFSGLDAEANGFAIENIKFKCRQIAPKIA